MNKRSVLFRCAGALVIAVMLAGCYVQRSLPREPTYTPASWEPIMGLRTRTGEQITFDEPGRIESGRVVYQVDGTRTSMSLDDIDRLFVGQKTLDKPKTVIFAAVFLAAFALFFASIRIE